MAYHAVESSSIPGVFIIVCFILIPQYAMEILSYTWWLIVGSFGVGIIDGIKKDGLKEKPLSMFFTAPIRDENDNVINTVTRKEMREKNLRYRCTFFMIFNSKGELLIQQRAKIKYHSGSLWSNTVCSNPKPSECCDRCNYLERYIQWSSWRNSVQSKIRNNTRWCTDNNGLSICKCNNISSVLSSTTKRYCSNNYTIR